jgi:hypothetical protein
MNKTLSIQVDGASDDSLPVYRGRECIGWINRSVVKYYNVHESLGQNVFRVGEAEWDGLKIWIFDRTCFQWAEFSVIPSVLSLE